MDASETLSLSAAWINYAWAREVPLESLVRLTVGSTPESPVDVAVGGRAEPKCAASSGRSCAQFQWIGSELH